MKKKENDELAGGEKKYELTDEIMTYDEGHVLHRIKALVDINESVPKGTLGGWVESEKNLSHRGNCWVYDDAKVYDDAVVFCNAKVYENAKICGNAKVYDNARVCDNAKIYGNARIYENGEVSGYAWVIGHARVFGHAKVFGFSMISDNATLEGFAKVYDDATVSEKATLNGNVRLYNRASIGGTAIVTDNAKVYDRATVFGNTLLCGKVEIGGSMGICGNVMLKDGKLSHDNEYINIGPLGSRSSYTTLNKTTGTICTGCFSGNIHEFKKAVEKTHRNNEFAKEYNLLIEYFNLIMKEYNPLK